MLRRVVGRLRGSTDPSDDEVVPVVGAVGELDGLDRPDVVDNTGNRLCDRSGVGPMWPAGPGSERVVTPISGKDQRIVAGAA